MPTLEADEERELHTPHLEEVTTEIAPPLAAAAADRCPSCRASMAADQRYCIECGERRAGGGLREALPRTQPLAAAPARSRRLALRSSANTSLIAGVGTLLLALGVGVLIGRSGHNAPAPAKPQVVTVQTNGAGAGTAATSTAAASTTKASKSSRKHKHVAAKTSANNSFQKTAAKSGVKLPPPVVKVGQKCQKGAKGCQGGKFTGNFFGGG